MRNRILLAVLVIAVAAVAYGVGRMQESAPIGEATQTEAPPQTASSPAGGQAEPAGAAAPPHQTGELGPATRNYLQFEIPQRNVKALLVDDETAWIGTSGGLIKYTSRTNSQVLYDNKTGLLSNGVFYVGEFDGNIWVGTYGGGLSILDPAANEWKNYNIPNGLADAFVYDVLRTRNGDVWIATWSGANRVVGGKLDEVESWRLYTVENTGGGLPNDWVYGLAEGKDGEIWLATEGGLARFADDEWSNWAHADGLGAPYEVIKDDVQFRNDPGQFSAHHARQKAEQGLKDVSVAYNPNYIVALLVDDAGDVWAGTWGGGLSRFDGKSWRTYTVRDGLPGNHVFSLGKGPSGHVWVGTSRGLARYDGAEFSRFSRADGLINDTVFSMALNDNGHMWIGSFGGVTWFPHGLRHHAANQ